MPNYIDRDLALQRAEAWAQQGFDVWFKFSCARCGQVVVLNEKNTLYEYGECCLCGHENKLDMVGFMVTKIL